MSSTIGKADPMIRGRRSVPAALLVAGLCLAACPGSFKGPQKGPTSAIWIAEGGPAPEASTISRLREMGVGEVFVEAARLGADGTIARIELPPLPPATPATLVVVGDGAALGGDVDTLAAALAAEARQLRFAAESRGMVPAGVHLDLASNDLERYGELLDRLRERLDEELFLSATVPRGWLDHPRLEDVTEAVDFVVAFLYGQRQDEDESPAAWDFVRMQRGLERLEDLDCRYLAGLVTVGTATLLDGDEVRGRTTRASFTELLWDRRLKLEPGFSLEGVNRQVYTLVADRPLRFGDWRVAKGQRIRLVRPATSHIEEYLRLRGAWPLENLLGQVYYRVPRPGENLSLTVDNLLRGLDQRPATPDVQLGASLRRSTGRGYLFQLSLVNRGDEITELSFLDHNYLEVRTDVGRFGRVKVGDFFRFVLFKENRDGELEATFRGADVIRLHLPMLEGEQQLSSGEVEIIAPREPRLTVTGRFLLTDGRALVVGPWSWQGGRLVDASAPSP